MLGLNDIYSFPKLSTFSPLSNLIGFLLFISPLFNNLKNVLFPAPESPVSKTVSPLLILNSGTFIFVP